MFNHKKNSVLTIQKKFVKKMHKSWSILNFFWVWSCHILIISSSRLPEKIEQFFKFLLSSFKCSQIWLIPLVDDSHCGYITKLKKKKKKNLLTAWWQPESAFLFSLAKCHLKGKLKNKMKWLLMVWITKTGRK